jgi:NhaA family Na+:H+ antiporter
MTTPSKRITRWVADFIRTESAAGIVMLLAAAAALIMANLPLTGALYQQFIHLPLAFGAGGASANLPLAEAVKDVLMVLFFLIVGLELKREMIEGVLADRRQILLPLLAALGGMAAPAAVFLFLNQSIPSHTVGWAIPSATDIAFALCVLLLAARNAPPALKIFLLAIAIFDDLGAILIIALFYSHGVSLAALLPVGLCVLALAALNRFHISHLLPYLALLVLLGWFLHHAGIHTTIAGVIAGMAIPMRDRAGSADSPLNRCMHFLHPWVSFGVLPLFAFTAAGVNLSGLSLDALSAPLTLGVMLGLFVGKQMGIFGTTLALVKLRLAPLPEGTTWRQIYAVSLLAGIGFTMSLFIGALAFTDMLLQEQVKLGVLSGSLLSALAGALLLRKTKA